MKPEIEDTDYQLTAQDRCDVCQAQAYVHVVLESGDLLFCLHHFNEYKDVLEPIALKIIDESSRLLVR
jgi:hypothetical protein